MIKLLRYLFVDDFLLKLLSLVLALLFWLTVSFAIQERQGSPSPTIGSIPEIRSFFNLPVVVMSSASDVRNFKVSPNQVEVTVRGDSRLLQNLRSKDIRVMVDLTGIEAAENLRKRIEVSTPAGVTLVSVLPVEVEVLIPARSSIQ